MIYTFSTLQNSQWPYDQAIRCDRSDGFVCYMSVDPLVLEDPLFVATGLREHVDELAEKILAEDRSL